MSAIQSEAQSLAPSALISLFMLDATKIGGPVWYFTSTSMAARPVSFGGTEYTPVGVELRGVTTSGVSELPRPELVLEADELIQAIVNTWGNLGGCTLTRYRTFARFLDGEAEADPTAFYGPDIFVIDRKSSDTPEQVTWELSAAIDQENATVGRTIIRDTCLWRYREWKSSSNSFDYSRSLCPYAGTKYFDVDDNPVATPDLDRPSRGVSCCKLRFGEGADLPFGGFPGVPRNAG